MLRNLRLATLFVWAARGIIRAQYVPPEDYRGKAIPLVTKL